MNGRTHRAGTPQAQSRGGASDAERDSLHHAQRSRAIDRGWSIAAAAALVIAVVAAYAPALRGGLLWDDDHHIRHADVVDPGGLLRLWTDLGTVERYGHYYPLTRSIFWLHHQLWGEATLGRHLTNALLHAGSALVLWSILRRLAVPGALLAAAVFALHPVHVESVAWMSELKNSLSGFLYLAAAAAYMRFDAASFAPPMDQPPPRRWSWYAAAILLFLAAVLSKSVTASLPAAIALILWWKHGALNLRRHLLPLAPLLGLAVAAGAFTAWAERAFVGASGERFELALSERFVLAGNVPWFYAWKLIWPVNLAFIYPRWSVKPEDWRWFIGPIAAAGLLTGLWLLRGRAGRGPLTAALYFGGTLVPVLGFLNVYPFRYSFVADHFQYLANIGPIAVLAAAATGLLRRFPTTARRWALVPGVAVAGGLGLLTWNRSHDFRDAETLWLATLKQNPACSMCLNNLGGLRFLRGDADGAIRAYRQSLEADPRNLEAVYNLASAQLALGQPREAVDGFRAAVMLSPNADAYYNMGIGLARTGRRDEAMEAFTAAIGMRPDFAEAHSNLGNVLLSLGRYDEAIAASRAALAVRPDFAEAHQNIGAALSKQGREREAISAFRAALAIRPDSAESLTMLAWLLATSADAQPADGAEAAALAERAIAVPGARLPGALDALAAGLARAGRFEEAAAAAMRAIEAANAAGDHRLARQVRERLAMYQRRQPHVAQDGP